MNRLAAIVCLVAAFLVGRLVGWWDGWKDCDGVHAIERDLRRRNGQ